jgi:uracil-DNA glycosylase family 4
MTGALCTVFAPPIYSAPTMNSWDPLNEAIIRCEKCPRLREFCERVARERRSAFADWAYWGRPVPNFGDPQARLLIVGLAPAAHGGNRTGRMFTGDRSGDWLYRALFESGFASQPLSRCREDGLRLTNCAVTAVLHCAPPANKPAPSEIGNCRAWLRATFDIVPARVYLALGRIAWQAVIRELRERRWITGSPPSFHHGRTVALAGGRWLVASYHPSQQNTFTGRLTESMWRDVFAAVSRLLEETGVAPDDDAHGSGVGSCRLPKSATTE